MTRARATSARLVPLAEAMRVLGGHHPIKLGIGEALPGVFDLKAIHAALDRAAGLTLELTGTPAPIRAIGHAANDDTDADAELVELAKRISADAARRA